MLGSLGPYRKWRINHRRKNCYLVVECSERTVLSCLEPVCLCWRHFWIYFSHHLAKSEEEKEKCLHLWVKVDQAVRPLPPKSLNILAGLTLKLYSLCITVSVVENIWMFWFVFRIFYVACLERFVLAGNCRNVKIL